MADYDNTNRITLFKVKDKTSEKSPDFTGNLYIGADILQDLDSEGLVRVAVWKQTSKDGVTYLNGSIQLPREETKKPKKAPKKEESFDDEDDDF